MKTMRLQRRYFAQFKCDEKHRKMAPFKASNGWEVRSTDKPRINSEDKLIHIIGQFRDDDEIRFEIEKEDIPNIQEAIKEIP